MRLPTLLMILPKGTPLCRFKSGVPDRCREESSFGCRRRMVEHIGRIQTHREALGFRDLNASSGWPCRPTRCPEPQPVPPERSSCAGQRSLQDDADRRNRECIKRTKHSSKTAPRVVLVHCGSRTFDTEALPLASAEEIARGCAFGPGVPAVFDVERPDDVRHAKAVQHALRRDRCQDLRNSDSRSNSPASFPPAAPTTPDALPNRSFGGPIGRCERAIVDHDVFPMRAKESVVSSAIGRIRDTRRAGTVCSFTGNLSEIPAPRVSQLRAHSRQSDEAETWVCTNGSWNGPGSFPSRKC